jgi:hypothetical protein
MKKIQLNIQNILFNFSKKKLNYFLSLMISKRIKFKIRGKNLLKIKEKIKNLSTLIFAQIFQKFMVRK